MLKRFALCVVAVSALAAIAGAPAGGCKSPVRFSVVQWNIGHFALGKDYNTAITDGESAARSAEYRAMIDRMKPDFLGISEYEPVFDKAGRSTESELFSSFPTKLTGTWSAPLSYNGNTTKAELFGDKMFTPFSPSGGNVATFDVTVAFDAVPAPRRRRLERRPNFARLSRRFSSRRPAV